MKLLESDNPKRRGSITRTVVWSEREGVVSRGGLVPVARRWDGVVHNGVVYSCRTSARSARNRACPTGCGSAGTAVTRSWISIPLWRLALGLV